VLRQSAIWQAALVTSRLWEHHEHSASLVPAFARIESNPALVQAVTTRRAERWTTMEMRWRAQNAQELERNPMLHAMSKAAIDGVGTRADELARAIADLAAAFRRNREGRISARLEALIAFRNKRLAHWDLRDSPKTRRAAEAALDDLVWTLGAASWFAERLALLCLGELPALRQHRMIRRRYAAAFWVYSAKSSPNKF
jgi:hypothetical protein